MADLDPNHTSCIGGKTVLTCRSCAGNAPRTSVTMCSTCGGKGFNLYACARCNPGAAANLHASAATSAASTPASLSRSSSTSVSNYSEELKREGQSGSGRLGNTTSNPRSHK